VDGIVHFVLNDCKKIFGHSIIIFIINAGGINIGYFLVKISFTASDIPDSLEKLLKIS